MTTTSSKEAPLETVSSSLEIRKPEEMCGSERESHRVLVLENGRSIVLDNLVSELEQTFHSKREGGPNSKRDCSPSDIAIRAIAGLARKIGGQQ